METRYEPITIIGVIAEQVGTPRNDGSPGSGLYYVPIRLSRSLDQREAKLLVERWNRPSQWTTMHRPGIATVHGDIFALKGTTIEEVRDYHAATLRLAVDAVNKEMPALLQREAEEAERQAAERKRHKENISDVVDQIDFG